MLQANQKSSSQPEVSSGVSSRSEGYSSKLERSVLFFTVGIRGAIIFLDFNLFQSNLQRKFLLKTVQQRIQLIVFVPGEPAVISDVHNSVFLAT